MIKKKVTTTNYQSLSGTVTSKIRYAYWKKGSLLQ